MGDDLNESDIQPDSREAMPARDDESAPKQSAELWERATNATSEGRDAADRQRGANVLAFGLIGALNFAATCFGFFGSPLAEILLGQEHAINTKSVRPFALFLLLLALPFGLLAWSFGSSELRQMNTGRTDCPDRYKVQLGRFLGMATILLMIVFAIYLVIFVDLMALKNAGLSKQR